jgi:glucose-1-phosphate adenylyltransferase
MLPVDNVASRTITFILAGGRGERLYPLTKEMAKPAIPIGCGYRLMDFTLSNCLKSGFRRVYVLTQYRADSVCQHIERLLQDGRLIRTDRDEFLICRKGEKYLGTADAVRQNLFLLEKTLPDFVLILSSDHVYRMDYTSLLRHHIQSGAALTIAAVEWPRATAHRFGVLQTDQQGRVLAFEEKPLHPGSIPGKPTRSLVNMGIYVFTRRAVLDALTAPTVGHDFGIDVIPRIAKTNGVSAYNFTESGSEHGTYWRDVGSIDSYYQATMDFLVVDSPINFLKEGKWPLDGLGHSADYRIRLETETLVANRSTVCESALLAHSVVCTDVEVNCGAEVRDSILMPGARIGRHVRIRRAIIDENSHIPDGIEIGFDSRKDAEYGKVTESGIVVIPSRS